MNAFSVPWMVWLISGYYTRGYDVFFFLVLWLNVMLQIVVLVYIYNIIEVVLYHGCIMGFSLCFLYLSSQFLVASFGAFHTDSLKEFSPLVLFLIILMF